MEKSQITIQSHQITIHSESGFTNKVKFFGSDLITMILGISLFLSLLFYFVAVAFFLILLILNRLIRRLPTNIIITNNTIGNCFKKFDITKRAYFDFIIFIKKDKAKIKLDNFKFKLKNIQDIPILTSEMAKILNLEFENQVQLTNQSEVLTYRKDNILIVPYKSYLNIYKSRNHFHVSDLKDTSNWFEINLNTQRVAYSRESFDNKKSIKASIPISNIKKIDIFINQKAAIFGNKCQIRILIHEIQETKVNLPLTIDNIWNDKEQHFLLKTSHQHLKHELTNLRDGEKLYQFFKKLPILKNIPIEKQIIT